jgi:hypothetical protein
MSKKPQFFDGPFIGYHRQAIVSVVFDTMRPLAQLLYFKARRFQNQDGSPVYISVRMAARLIGIKKLKTARSLIEELIHYGFWKRVSVGYLGTEGRGVAASFQYTDVSNQNYKATNDFAAWDGTMFDPNPKTETRVTRVHRPRVPKVHRTPKKPNKNGISVSGKPVYPQYTHLDASHLPIAINPKPDAGMGHNQGPPLEPIDDGLDIPEFLRRE